MLLTHITVSGVRCDAGTCTAEITGPPKSHWEGAHYYEALAETQGWTIWAGRSRVLRCPAHPPRPGGRMRRVTPRLAPGIDRDDCPCRELTDLARSAERQGH